MNWQYLFLSTDGRIGQRDFWIGIAILFVAGLVLGMIPVLGTIVSLALVYPGVCLYAKRLHDFGKSGWLQIIPLAPMVLAMVLAILTGSAFLGGPLGGAAAVAGLGLTMAVSFLAVVVGIAFLLWVGLAKGDPEPNAYGKTPVSIVVL